MRVLVSGNLPKGRISTTDYNWCEPNELLMFGQFQAGKGNPSEINMFGIETRKGTTHIFCKDLDISKEFYKELITQSVENAMGCEIDRKGDYEIEVGFSMHFNINNIMNELLEKADNFKDGDKISCLGRTLILFK